MIQTDELRGIITKRNMSQASVAKAIGITPKTVSYTHLTLPTIA